MLFAAGAAVVEVPVIGQRVAVGIGGGRGEGHGAADVHGGGAGGQRDRRRGIAREGPAEIGDVERGGRGVVFRQHGEVHVAFEVGEGAPDLDAAVVLAAGAARGGVDQVAAVEHDRLVREGRVAG